MPWTESDLPVWRTARYTVAELPTEIDISNADEVEERLMAVATTDRPARVPLIVDLSGTTFCDSTAVSALLRVRARLASLERRVYAVLPPRGIIRKVFEVAAISHLIPFCDDLGSAVALAVVDALDESDEPDSGRTPV